MFVKQSLDGLKALFLVVFSLVLFFCDLHYNCFDNARAKLSLIALPAQRVVNWPLKLFQTLSLIVSRKQAIIEENDRLASELLLINTRLQRLNFLEQENAQLRSLLYSSKRLGGKVLFAELISSEVGLFGQTAMIDKGELDGVYVGQPVLDDSGLLGQVVLVQDRSSKVLLVTSDKSAVPVMVERNGLQAVAIGKGDNSYLELGNITRTVDLKEGDVLVTSGLGQTFPAGYLVGVVKKIQHIVGERFEKVLVEPKAEVSKRLHVILIWPDSHKKIAPSKINKAKRK